MRPAAATSSGHTALINQFALPTTDDRVNVAHWFCMYDRVNVVTGMPFLMAESRPCTYVNLFRGHEVGTRDMVAGLHSHRDDMEGTDVDEHANKRT